MFARQIFMALISLFTIRVLISELGITDFALLNVTLSVVSLSMFIIGSLEMITQRYIAYAIGKGDAFDLKRYHDALLVLHFSCVVITVLALETLGAWFVSNELVVAPDRIGAVQVLYQFLIFSFVVKIIVGFHSWVIIAHEDMHVFAMFSILDAVLRLAAALLIGVLGTDGLITYGPALVAGNVLVLAGQWIYCATRYEECRIGRIHFDFKTLRGMFDFVGWTFFGQFTTVCRTYAITILINQAFSPATVAARALSFTIYNQTLVFARNFTSALGPPIIKSYAGGDKEQTFSLIFLGRSLPFSDLGGHAAADGACPDRVDGLAWRVSRGNRVVHATCLD
nr:hypothetical protein [Marinicella sp. W31]MDC2875954.1 hypothetical protein [Marinicella sp. W31]